MPDFDDEDRSSIDDEHTATALDRIEELETLGLVEIEEVVGRGTKETTIRSEFRWPDELKFPRV